MKKFKGFIAGFTCAAVIVSSTVVGFASTGSKTMTAAYNNIKIYVNQQLITPKTASGAVVEPFVVDGTTYLPVRAVAEALGQNVTWDGSTNSVYIGGQPTRSDSTQTTTGSTQTTTESAATSKVLMDKNGIKITYTGVKIGKKSYDEDEICLKIENSSSINQTVQVRDFSINGVMVDPIFSCDVAKGKTAIDSIKIFKSDLSERSITSIDSFECKFHVFNWDEYDSRFDSNVVKVSVK